MSHTWGPPGDYSHARDFVKVSFNHPANGTNWGYIKFQDGPFKAHKENGTTLEEVIDILIERLEALNTPPFQCAENTAALTYLRLAKDSLDARTQQRILRLVEGTDIP